MSEMAQLGVRAPHELVKRIDCIANYRGCTRTDVVLEALGGYAEKNYSPEMEEEIVCNRSDLREVLLQFVRDDPSFREEVFEVFLQFIKAPDKQPDEEL
ncbi:hypothetical protein AZH53_06145 [Methanomicrobiaceae archaeon CYW5]|uniref:hypothetical protein n=1 Tax=Methanovulcanius yangii TaxID=1789227 RepID=UPI0029CA4FC1|nr:hypothetical protein [Methanovulcanius yangii]MBT8507989.1 hypothetical protein [Methanovulcanius yangii]